MRVLLSWLQEFIDLDLPLQDLDDTLTLAGLEVDAIENATFQFKGVVIGKVVACEPHPDADRLKVATVFDGKEEHTVVCGGANCRDGLIVAFAPVGAQIQEHKITKAKLRGVQSFGMLCSDDELMLTKKKADGIMELPEDAPIGENLATYLYDPIIEVSLTPNLGHAASILGVARELSAQLNLPYKKPDPQIKGSAKNGVSIAIKEAKSCLQFRMRTIGGVKVGPSPSWLADRLTKSGFNTINNIVDAINYVMLELGQPMHGFDLEKLPSKKIEVKKNAKELSLKTLDSVERKVPAGTLLIYDSETPLAIAGVMGGEESAIQEGTTDIVIEAAQFDPTEVRRSMKGCNLRSDSSYRFEKGIDPIGTQIALDAVVELICQIAGGTPASDSLVEVAQEYEARSIKCRLSQIERLIGIQLSQNEVRTMLKRLEFDVKVGSDDALMVTPPSYRNDVHTEIEVIEEVARLYGFNNIERDQCRFSISSITHDPLYVMERKVRTKLAAEGLQEWITCNLISPQMAQIGLTPSLQKENLISMLHAKSVDQSILRATFLPPFLATVKHNHNQQQFDLAAFEVGTLHFKEGDQISEKRGLAIVLSGKEHPHHFDQKPQEVNFFTLKGHVENLMIALGITAVEFRRSQLPPFHPHRQCEVVVNERVIGVMGEVHPDECAKLNLDTKKRVYFAQLDLELLMGLEVKRVNFTPLPQYPHSQRDITLTVSSEVTLESLYERITKANAPHLRNIELIDIFRDEEKVGKGKQNITLRFTYRDDEKTIEMGQVDEEHQLISTALTQ